MSVCQWKPLVVNLQFLAANGEAGAKTPAAERGFCFEKADVHDLQVCIGKNQDRTERDIARTLKVHFRGLQSVTRMYTTRQCNTTDASQSLSPLKPSIYESASAHLLPKNNISHPKNLIVRAVEHAKFPRQMFSGNAVCVSSRGRE